jgi:hypothetical protein
MNWPHRNIFHRILAHEWVMLGIAIGFILGLAFGVIA